MVASEAAPYAQTGGLGDVVSGLSLALAGGGSDVVIVTPRYGLTRAPAGAHWWADVVHVEVGEGHAVHLGVLEATIPAGEHALRVCFLDHPGLFARDGIYGDAHGTFGDNDVRFAAMSRGALAVARRLWPDGAEVVHAHDWHAALAVIDAKGMGPHAALPAQTVLTIHNLAFQGVFGADVLGRIGVARRAFESGVLEHDGQVNLLKGAIVLADRVTTVSPTYAREILGRREGCGLDAVLRGHRGKLIGILNGIDETWWDPSTDESLASRYEASSPDGARRLCKAALEGELGLRSPGGPLFATVSRFTEQKGIDLLLAVVPGLVERGASFALVGAGDAAIERAVAAAARERPGRVASRIVFDEHLARRVYAGADFFLVPSRYEPCGLTQQVAMRYGAIPIVTGVGGLVDTVTPISAVHEVGTGFVAPSPDASDLLVACEDALAMYADASSHHAAVRRAMRRDAGWTAPALEYLAAYGSSAETLAETVDEALPFRGIVDP
jgi:starch synthase